MMWIHPGGFHSFQDRWGIRTRVTSPVLPNLHRCHASETDMNHQWGIIDPEGVRISRRNKREFAQSY